MVNVEDEPTGGTKLGREIQAIDELYSEKLILKQPLPSVRLKLVSESNPDVF